MISSKVEKKNKAFQTKMRHDQSIQIYDISSISWVDNREIEIESNFATVWHFAKCKLEVGKVHKTSDQNWT